MYISLWSVRQEISQFCSNVLSVEECIQCIYKPQFAYIHSSIDEHLGHFHILAIVNNAAMNLSIQVSVQVPVSNSFEYVLKSGIAVI